MNVNKINKIEEFLELFLSYNIYEEDDLRCENYTLCSNDRTCENYILRYFYHCL